MLGQIPYLHIPEQARCLPEQPGPICIAHHVCAGVTRAAGAWGWCDYQAYAAMMHMSRLGCPILNQTQYYQICL